MRTSSKSQKTTLKAYRVVFSRLFKCFSKRKAQDEQELHEEQLEEESELPSWELL